MIPISEASFLAQVKALAFQYGWLFHHATPSMTSKGRWITTGAPGFVDIVMAHPERGVIMAELKTAKGKTTAAQDGWIRALAPHVECYLWRPSDLTFIAQRLSQC